MRARSLVKQHWNNRVCFVRARNDDGSFPRTQVRQVVSLTLRMKKKKPAILRSKHDLLFYTNFSFGHPTPSTLQRPGPCSIRSRREHRALPIVQNRICCSKLRRGELRLVRPVCIYNRGWFYILPRLSNDGCCFWLKIHGPMQHHLAYSNRDRRLLCIMLRLHLLDERRLPV